MKHLPLRVRAYITGCGAVAIAAGALAWRADDGFVWSVALGFGLLCFLAENVSITTPLGSTYSVGFVLTIAAIYVAGPREAIVATLCGTMALRDIRDRPLFKHAFNAAQLATSTALASLAFTIVNGGAVTGPPLPRALIPLLVCTAVNFPTNTLLVSGAVALSERRSVLRVWRAQYAQLGPTYIAFAFLGLLLGILYVQMTWASVLFLLMPLLVARHAFQAAIEMQDSYDQTVRSLIGVFEAKDPYTRGHAQRVSRLAEMAARAYGLTETDCRRIRYAALMHDIGKLTVHSAVLRKSGKLTAEEYDHMKIHPIRGVEIIDEIDLLKEAIDGVRYHHEKMDGTGYPDGLRGDEIPLFARLIMVADAFDSMTSTRTYRKALSIEQAFGELRRCEGTQFDPASLRALERAVERHGWEPTPELEDFPAKTQEDTDARVASL